MNQKTLIEVIDIIKASRTTEEVNSINSFQEQARLQVIADLLVKYK